MPKSLRHELKFSPASSGENCFLRNNSSYTRISPSKSTDGGLPQRDSLFTFGIPQPRFFCRATFDSLLQNKIICFAFWNSPEVWYFPSKVKRCHFSSKKIIQNLPADRQMIPQQNQ